MSELLLPGLYELNIPKEPVLPDPDEISYYILEKERKLYLDFDIKESITSVERMILRWNIEDKKNGIPPNERRPIWLYILSNGGYLYCMWSVVDIIEASVTPIYTVNIGLCASAASIIFISGHKRFMMPRAKVLIHEGSAAIEGDAQKVQDQADSYKKEVKAMKEYILNRTNIPKAQLMKKRNNDWELDASYCLENKVCDVIINTLDDVI